MAIYHSVSQLVGNTPLLSVDNYGRRRQLDAAILVKLERFNPAGSAKDRVALEMLDQAEATGGAAARRHRHRAHLRQYRHRPGGHGRGPGLSRDPHHARLHERRAPCAAEGATARSWCWRREEAAWPGRWPRRRSWPPPSPDSFFPGQFDNPANPAAHISHHRPGDLAGYRGQGGHLRGGRGHRRHHQRHRPLSEGAKPQRP